MISLIKTLFIFMSLTFLSEANAGVSGSVNLGYQRTWKTTPLGFEWHPGNALKYNVGGGNCWQAWDVDVGYQFSNGKWGVFGGVNKFEILTHSIDDVGNEIKGNLRMSRISFVIFGSWLVWGQPHRFHAKIEGGPSINFHDVGTVLYDDDITRKSDNLGAVAGLNFVIPNRFANVQFRARYIVAGGYKNYSNSGIGVSVGIGFGGI